MPSPPARIYELRTGVYLHHFDATGQVVETADVDQAAVVMCATEHGTMERLRRHGYRPLCWTVEQIKDPQPVVYTGVPEW